MSNPSATVLIAPFHSLEEMLFNFEEQASEYIGGLNATAQSVWDHGLKQTATFVAKQGAMYLVYQFGGKAVKMLVPESVHGMVDGVIGGIFVVGTAYNVIDYASRMVDALREYIDLAVAKIREWWNTSDAENDPAAAEAVKEEVMETLQNINKVVDESKAQMKVPSED